MGSPFFLSVFARKVLPTCGGSPPYSGAKLSFAVYRQKKSAQIDFEHPLFTSHSSLFTFHFSLFTLNSSLFARNLGENNDYIERVVKNNASVTTKRDLALAWATVAVDKKISKDDF